MLEALFQNKLLELESIESTQIYSYYNRLLNKINHFSANTPAAFHYFFTQPAEIVTQHFYHSINEFIKKNNVFIKMIDELLPNTDLSERQSKHKSKIVKSFLEAFFTRLHYIKEKMESAINVKSISYHRDISTTNEPLILPIDEEGLELLNNTIEYIKSTLDQLSQQETLPITLELEEETEDPSYALTGCITS